MNVEVLLAGPDGILGLSLNEVADLGLRLLVAIGAGAMLRMLVVFKLLPLAFAILLLGVIGGALSMRLKATRFVVVLATSLAYFIAWWFTQASAAPAEGAVPPNPTPWDLAFASLEAFSPFLTPVIGSGIALVIEKQKQEEPVEEEVTEESLLAEKLPSAEPRDLYYDMTDEELRG